MSNSRTTLIALLLTLTLTSVAQGDSFTRWFDGRTLRLDYVFAGSADSQHIYFQQAGTTPEWAGRKARLTEAPLRGNGQIVLADHDSGELIYRHTFSTLFQEWLSTEEATRLQRAFEASYQVPMPRRKTDVTVTLTDARQRMVATMTHTLDPADILIRPLADSGSPHRYLLRNGSMTDCVDLAIVAEGYTEMQMGKFYDDCQRLVDALFSHEPFATLKGRFNVVAVACPSRQSGPSIPHEGRWNLTPVGTTYDTFYSNRYLMTPHMHRLYDVLAGVPFEQVIVLVNSATYGGGGIYNQVNVTTSDHPTFAQVLVHEFGHGYAGLGDEYAYDDSYETVYPPDVEPWEPNLTTLVDFASKWADLVPDSVDVPTAPLPLPDHRRRLSDEERTRLNAATQRVGVYEGAGYQSRGVYRPAQECRMKINEVEHFCPVCTRAIVSITDFYTSH